MSEIFEKGYFFNPTKGNLKKEEVLDEVLNYFRAKPERKYEIVVGCDSSDREAHFFVVVVVLRKGEGGRFFAKKIDYSRTFHSLKERVLQEVLISCELATELREEIKQRVAKEIPHLDYQFEYIHADIGTNGPTKEMIKEIVNLIKGNGFLPKIKPESFAASVVADRFC